MVKPSNSCRATPYPVLITPLHQNQTDRSAGFESRIIVSFFNPVFNLQKGEKRRLKVTAGLPRPATDLHRPGQKRVSFLGHPTACATGMIGCRGDATAILLELLAPPFCIA